MWEIDIHIQQGVSFNIDGTKMYIGTGYNQDVVNELVYLLPLMCLLLAMFNVLQEQRGRSRNFSSTGNVISITMERGCMLFNVKELM